MSSTDFLWSCSQRYPVGQLNRPSTQFAESCKDASQCLMKNCPKNSKMSCGK